MSRDEHELCQSCAHPVKRASRCIHCGRAARSVPEPEGASEAVGEFSSLTNGRPSRRSRSRHAVEAILEAYPAEQVNWSAVAHILGVSRQAVHQVKQRLKAPTISARSDVIPNEHVPLRGSSLAPRPAVKRRAQTTTAIILAGGPGTRLRPLTFSRRKELIPLLNRPLLEYRLRNLNQHGITDVVLACSQGMNEVEQEFGDGAALGLRLRYSYEDRPLGSGRAIKQAARAVEATGTLLVCNGDILTNVDVAAMLRSHHQSGATISISLKSVDDPWHFGVVRMRDDLRISEFIEKPPPGLEPSNLINAGTWLWEPEVLDRIPDDDSAIRDGFAERSLFPAVIEDGLLVQGFIEDGLWVDVGTPERYLRATELLMAGAPPAQLGGVGRAAGVHFIGNSVVGKGVHIGEDARIVGPTVIGDGCSIGSGAVIDRSVLWEDVEVGAGSQLVGSILGQAVTVGARASVIDAVLGDRSRIGDGLHLEVGARMEAGAVRVVSPARRYDRSRSV